SQESNTKSDNESGHPNEIVPILIRRRWYFLAPLFTLGLLGYAVANLLPLQYRSSAFIIVEQRKVPDQFVLPNVLMSLQKRLDSLFIEQDARERTSQSRQTTTFLENQLEQARKELASEEAKVGEYKLKHLGELPAQQESTLRILSSLEAQLQANTARLDRAEQ